MIKRELYLKKIRHLIGKDVIKVLTGIRRCGKSSMLHLIIDELIEEGINKDNIILINFESAKYMDIDSSTKLNNLIENLTHDLKGPLYLFFDEVQNVKNWEKSINSYRIDLDAEIFITGSNANLLSGELATLIAGRYVEIKIYPFSFKESLKLKFKDSDEKKFFMEYLKYGGMPLVLQLNRNEKIDYLRDLYNSIILKDIVYRNNIREVDLFDKLIKFLMDNIGCTFSAKSISKFFKNENRIVSRDTIYNYLIYLQEACLIHKVQREDLIGKKILKIYEKYYFTDHGFNETIAGKNIKNIGQILENIVYMEFLRRGYEIYVGKLNNVEIDFICKNHEKTFYVQVSYLLASEKTIEREFNSLLKIKDNHEKILITMDEVDFSQKGIKHLNIIDFLKSNDF
ncbi:archaeal ATPase [Methanobrevibacter cuticularis]|uniref:Archaeal ATPase n=1 Tax=Methanobrevibacter cuticularis TaxID=47311 RepID=A0A166E109_9EURY|nr:ATP-binding protein [Methanobrevibacter cuticularis]KZX16160.1 archaeal ATPase [Methanobrevibacter cuticularis]